MAWQRSHAVPGPPPNRLLSCWLIWNGGEPTTMLCVPMNHCGCRSYIRVSEVARRWHNATGNRLQPWRLGEPIADGRRARCFRALCQGFPLEGYRSQRWVQDHVAGRWLKFQQTNSDAALLWEEKVLWA